MSINIEHHQFMLTSPIYCSIIPGSQTLDIASLFANGITQNAVFVPPSRSPHVVSKCRSSSNEQQKRKPNQNKTKIKPNQNKTKIKI